MVRSSVGAVLSVLRAVCIRAGLVLAIAGVAGCGADVVSEYDDANADAFLAACMSTETDELLQQRVCQCVIEGARAAISFERFREINELLEDDPEAPFPADLLGLVGTCVVEEADL